MKSTTTKLIAIAIIAVLALSLLAGCSNGTTTNEPAEKAATHQNGSSRQSYDKLSEDKPSRISKEEANEIALAHAGINASDAVFTDKEYDLDDGTPVYELEFFANGVEYDYEIHAETGDVLLVEREKESPKPSQPAPTAPSTPAPTPAPNPAPAPDPQPAAPAAISDGQAKEIALSHAGLSADKVIFDRVERDRDDGVPVIEIEFKSGKVEYSYEIHAESGKILEFDKDIDD